MFFARTTRATWPILTNICTNHTLAKRKHVKEVGFLIKSFKPFCHVWTCYSSQCICFCSDPTALYLRLAQKLIFVLFFSIIFYKDDNFLRNIMHFYYNYDKYDHALTLDSTRPLK